MATVESDKLSEVLKCVCSTFSVEELKAEQLRILKSMLGKKDCIAVLPTGYGKSLPYQIFLPVVRELQKCNDADLGTEYAGDLEGRIIVCCPLVALMQDQVQRLQCIPDLRVLYKGDSHEKDEMILRGEFDILFASPESLVGDSKFRHQLQNYKVGMIVIDEFHTIATWGGDDDSDEYRAFRKWFRHVGELRSLFPSASILALSATCTNKIRTRVMKVLNLIEKETTVVSISPNKPNIKFAMKKVDNHVESAMYWLIEGLSNLKETFPRMLIYCNSILDVSKLYNHVVGEINECAKFVDMFHSETPDENKELIISALREKDSEKRVIFATSALGMGIDVVDCNSIVLYGPPRTMVDLVQLVGRVGRDGGQSVALVLHNSYNIRSVDKDMKKLISCKTCRRKEIMGNFLSETDLLELCKLTGVHTCCDLCEESCCCGKCKLLDLEKLFSNQCINNSDSDSDTIDYEYVPDQPDEHDIDNLDDEFYLSEVFDSFETPDVE